eukprot:1140105-Pelagomonas_calceolata.AAC.4
MEGTSYIKKASSCTESYQDLLAASFRGENLKPPGLSPQDLGFCPSYLQITEIVGKLVQAVARGNEVLKKAREVGHLHAACKDRGAQRCL